MKLSKTYEPASFEPRIYNLWETSGAFKPAPPNSGDYFSIALPPPNANGNLHIGHGLVNAVQDTLIRYNRMLGKPTVYIPGADHAGFETWTVFERQLQKEGKSRFDYSRDQLYQMVWDFVEKQRGNMEVQLRELGASLDWDHLVFTLDKKVIDQTYKTFKKMWSEGLIYRGERIVNFCPTHQTSFADYEVVHQPQKTKLWSIAYTLVDKVGEIVVATTRPETMLGDTAIAVHPNDTRYKDLIGKRAWVPLVEREIPIVGDDTVDPKFGTGAVKVTPAHDPVDFEIGERHQLPAIQVVGFDGKMTAEVPQRYQGLDHLEARAKVIDDLKTGEALRGEKDYQNTVGVCYRCGTLIQPLIKDQWFLKVAPLAQRAIKAIEDGQVTFTPANKGKVLINYYKNLRDWNLSRQIAWGIPIPAFQSSKDHTKWIFDERIDQPTITVDSVVYHREEDTFDTWFSSSQWPFIVTGYLEKGDLSQFYPLSIMETAGEILFPWVSRMIMLGLYLTDQVPFKHVYLHGLVLDPHGQKMSKSKGNVVNPQEPIKQFGSDAFRIGMLANRSPGVNQAFSTGSVVAGRNFCNKLWNIARYIEDKLGSGYKPTPPKPETIADHWIFNKLNKASARVGKLLQDYRLAEATELMYHTIWDDLADWYIEASKTKATPSVLAYALETSLKLAHPFAPFVTETIWQTLGWHKELLINSSWPKQVTASVTQANKFAEIQKLVSEIRFVSTDLASGKQKLIYTGDKLIQDNVELIKRLGGLESVEQVGQGRGLRLAVAAREAWLDIDAKTLAHHHSKLQARLDAANEQIERLKFRLKNRAYTEHAPQEVVAQTRQQLAEQETLAERLSQELKVQKA